ncbi:hypothetical protein [Paenibacillus ehimensis]|uniref:Uncharacterized protein n=1 Tax=Paenibacillus ehimensis TaxID=79264 RepID=A0ABT8V8N1_9BACL|nr:hypothetical protein [Paenibacillus ehimensis]MDO3676385.1 hypothetical protein [Paenibacillus ehimensis]MEC0211211.1 hypothetical protein [Paenibacillus ehimensis]
MENAKWDGEYMIDYPSIGVWKLKAGEQLTVTAELLGKKSAKR